MTDTERITHAAVKAENGWAIMGKSHADCFHQAANTGIEMSSKALDQGFVTSKGRFVTRECAAHIAQAANQIGNTRGYLFSENLWSERHGGLFKYDSIKGYYR